MKNNTQGKDMTATLVNPVLQDDTVQSAMYDTTTIELNPNSLAVKLDSVPDEYKSQYELAYFTAQHQAQLALGMEDDESNVAVLMLASANADSLLRTWQYEALLKAKEDADKKKALKSASGNKSNNLYAIARTLRSGIGSVIKAFIPDYKETLAERAVDTSNLVTQYRFLLMAILMKSEFAKSVLAQPLLTGADTLTELYGSDVVNYFTSNVDLNNYLVEGKTIEQVADEWATKVTEEELAFLLTDAVTGTFQPGKKGRSKATTQTTELVEQEIA